MMGIFIHTEVNIVTMGTIPGVTVTDVESTGSSSSKSPNTVVTVEADKLKFVPQKVIEQRVRFRALLSTGFASAGGEEDLKDTLRFTRVESKEEIEPNKYEYEIEVQTPF